MITSTPPTDSEKPGGPFMDDALPQGDPVEVARFIARVLRHAHRKAMTVNAADNARGVLYVAHCFADELAPANPRFDRLHFIQEATEHES